MFIVLAGVVDVGSVMYTMSELDAAVSAGAQYAENNAALVTTNRRHSTDIGNVVNDTNGTGWATSAVDVNNGNDATGCYCPTGTPGSWSWGGAVSCQATAAAAASPASSVTITASRSFSRCFRRSALSGTGRSTAARSSKTQ